MKFNKISMVLAALAFVGCSSEDLNEFSATPAVEDSNLIQLGSDFVLAGASAEGTTTRTHWKQVVDAEGNKSLLPKFLPIYTAAPSTGDVLAADVDKTEQAVGLCWLGNGATGTDVYTNYQFYHFGWLKNGQKTATFDCGKLTNGALYDEITLTATGSEAIGDEATETAYTGYTALSGKTGTPSTDLDFNSGVYKTENKSIFGGQYIVYYPYNEDFKDAGTIPATAKTNWANVPMAFDAPELGKETFRYSAPVAIEGGNQATDFGLKNLSALVRLKIAAPASDAAVGKTIDQIVLFSESKKLLKQANLAADKIAAGKVGAELYASTEGTKTIVAKSSFALPAANTTFASPFITVLPTTVPDLVVFVHNSTDGKWARVNLGNTEFEAGSAKALTITVADADFTTDYIAVDENSLTTALNNARNEIIGNANARPTITVIGDITLGAVPTYSIMWTNIDDKITIKGDDIIVPQDVTLNLKTIMQSNVRVLGRSCCTGANGGRLEVYGGTISNVTLEETEATAKNDNTNPKLTYNTDATVAAGKTVDVQAGNVVVKAKVQHKGDIKIAKTAKVTVEGAGDLNFMGSSVTNDGTIEVEKDGNFDMTNSQGGATADDGKRMTNNGKFIHNVDAQVGTAVQSMVQNGEYRCKVEGQQKLDDAYLQWTACSVIEMVGNGDNYNLGTAASIATPYQHNGKYIDIEVNTTTQTTFTNPAYDNNVIMIGNLTVKNNGGLNIDYVNDNGLTGNARKEGKRTLTVNGNMTVSANTIITDSKKINVTKNLTVNSGKTLTYKGNKKNEGGLAVTKDITVTGNNSTFIAGGSTANADEVDALDITCANFYLKSKGTAIFGNRTDGAAKNLVVSGTIDNPANCTFNIVAAGQYNGSVLAWVTCKELKVGGSFPGARPRVE